MALLYMYQKQNNMEKTIEIPFGAKDSELKGWEYTIPEDMEAEIKDGKVIVREKESDDEKIRKTLLRCCDDWEKGQFGCMAKKDVPAIRAYLERKKEQKTAVEEVLIKAGLKPFKDGNQWCILVGDNIQEGVCGFGDTIEDALYEFLKEVCEQQKPAEWNDADMNEVRKDLISLCRDWERGEKTTLLPVVAVRARYFLEHLTEPQQPAKWSETDKLHLNIAILVAKKEWGVNSYTARWLESLRDNYKKCNSHWKPSEEQMWALDVALENFYHQSDRSALESLKTDLQKLL